MFYCEPLKELTEEHEGSDSAIKCSFINYLTKKLNFCFIQCTHLFDK